MSALAAEPTPIPGDIDLSAVGALLADASRARVLLALGDGRSLCASMLAGEAGVSASTISSHLSKLIDAGWLSCEIRGRYRYYRIAGPAVAEAIETLARLAPPAPVRSLREGTKAHAVRRARRCYDHLAGKVGVALADRLVACGYAVPDDDGLTLTVSGRRAFAGLAVELPASDHMRGCVDWTEQRHHVGGAHGRAILARLVDLGWLRRSPSNRAMQITDAGSRGLRDHFGVDVTAFG
ncbi:MAG TPA: helix-turn-helix transcriptional regulator [Mycobacteriales bacterium]|nr:helix-turn-helix transcriptional regulator [Mycobacteriales bacterium]